MTEKIHIDITQTVKQPALLIQEATLEIGKAPAGDGWRIISGNDRINWWARVVHVDELEDNDQ